MVNKSKNKGTAFETAVVRYLIDSHGLIAERRALYGGQDRGDIGVATHTDWPTYKVTIEAKDRAALNIAGALDEAIVEAANAKDDLGVAVLKRRGTNVSQSYVVMRLEDFARILADMRRD